MPRLAIDPYDQGQRVKMGRAWIVRETCLLASTGEVRSETEARITLWPSVRSPVNRLFFNQCSSSVSQPSYSLLLRQVSDCLLGVCCRHVCMACFPMLNGLF